MGVYLYCIGPEDLPPPPEELAGLDGAPLSRSSAGPFHLWTSPSSERPAPTPERLRSHDRVVRAAHSPRITALPVRFGQWFEDPDALDARILDRAEELRETLDEVRGAVEFAVRIVDPSASPEEPAGAASGGRAYMEELARRHAAERREHERGLRLADEMAGHLGGTVRRQRRARKTEDRVLTELSHLVSRSEIRRYRRGLDEYRSAHPELQLLVTGPWPPYSFAA